MAPAFSAGVSRPSIVANSASQSVSLTVALGELEEPLPLPQGVLASEQGAAGASVSWGPVAGAASYYVGVWERQSGAFAA